MESTKLTANELLAYQAISSFVSEANAVGGSTQKSLQLYNRLIQKTQISHVEAIKKHIVAFKKFCQDNQEALKEQEIDTVIHVAARVGGVAANIKYMSDFYSENIQINTNICTGII